MLLSRKLLFYQNQFPKEYFVPGSYSATLVPGTYEIIVRGAGGAGGENGRNGAGTGGIGGAGSSGSLTRSILTVQNVTTATVYVGSKGVLSGTDYNGGAGGAGGGADAMGYGGSGGGAGKPSYVLINNILYSADSGAGGGGGGGCGTRGRNANGGGGGGGGGRYKLSKVTGYTAKRTIQLIVARDENNNLIIREYSSDNVGVVTGEITIGDTLYVGKTWTYTVNIAYDINITYTYTIDSILQNGDIILSCVYNDGYSTAYIGPSTITDVWSNTVIITSVAGKKGSDFVNNSRGANGVTGNTAEFPNLYSGGGGAGHDHGGSNGAYGGGASGGSGGDAGNDSNVHSGSGGGAAGGDNNAGGGTSGSIRAGGSGSNPHTTVTDTTSENALYGITGDYGTGGTTATAGKNGFVVIRQLFIISETINLGNVNESVASTWNLGSITDSVTETKDCGNII